MHPCHRIAWYWTTINRQLDRGAEFFGPRYLRLRFEDFFGPQAGGLGQFLDWFGLARSPQLAATFEREKINASHAAFCPPWAQWPAEVQQAVLDECGPLMESYGYQVAVSP